VRLINHLKERYAVILSAIGLMLLLCSGLLVTPLLALFVWPDQMVHAPEFAMPAVILAMIGMMLWRFFRIRSFTPLSVQEGGLIVLTSWLIVIVFSAWPLMTILHLPFSRALFESVSGWTTTGLSVVDVEVAGPLILLWRSIIQLAGGAGLAIMMMSALIGPTGIGISKAEGRGDQLVPQIRQSARLVLIIYGTYAVSGVVAYYLAGMSLFDAINHSFAAVSTGGFSTHTQSIGYWDSPLIEAITLPLMFLGNLSFVTAWFLFRGKLLDVSMNGEIRLQAVLVPLSMVLFFLMTTQTLYPHLGKSIRVAIFEVMTAITTTGFSTVSYSQWNSFGINLLVILMLIGGGVCSTAGGIKQFRIYLLGKLVFWEFKRYISSPNAILVRPIWEGGRRVFVDDDQIRQLTVFVSLYLATFATGVLLLCAHGFSLESSLFEFASAMGTVGLSVGITSAQMPDSVLWAEIVAMFLGRLEITMVFVSVFKLKRDAGLMVDVMKKKRKQT